MRVAMFCNYPVNPEVIPGGVTAVAHYLTKGLGRIPEVDLHIICSQGDVPADKVESRDGATIHFLRDPERFTQLTGWRAARRRIAGVVTEIQPDLAHAQGLGLPTAAGLDTRLPFVLSLHGILWKEATMHHPSPWKRMRGMLRARAALSQIRRTRNVFITSGYAGRALPPGGHYRRFVVNNPAGDAFFSIENRPGPPRILVVGGLRHRKDPMTTVRIAERVLGDVPDATLRLLGPPSNTPLDEEVRRFVEDRGLSDRVQLLGLVSDEVLREEYRHATLLLLPSIEETAPVALSETHAVGIPVVGSDAGGIPDMVREGETGFIRPVGDVPALAECVVRLLTDGDLRARMAARAKETGVEEFSTDAIARKTVDAYREILT